MRQKRYWLVSWLVSLLPSFSVTLAFLFLSKPIAQAAAPLVFPRDPQQCYRFALSQADLTLSFQPQLTAPQLSGALPLESSRHVTTSRGCTQIHIRSTPSVTTLALTLTLPSALRNVRVLVLKGSITGEGGALERLRLEVDQGKIHWSDFNGRRLEVVATQANVDLKRIRSPLYLETVHSQIRVQTWGDPTAVATSAPVSTWKMEHGTLQAEDLYYPLSFSSLSARLQMKDTYAPIQGQSQSGLIAITQAKAPLSLQSSLGSIEVGFSSPIRGGSTLESESGSILVTTPTAVPTSFDVEALSLDPPTQAELAPSLARTPLNAHLGHHIIARSRLGTVKIKRL